MIKQMKSSEEMGMKVYKYGYYKLMWIVNDINIIMKIGLAPPFNPNHRHRFILFFWVCFALGDKIPNFDFDFYLEAITKGLTFYFLTYFLCGLNLISVP